MGRSYLKQARSKEISEWASDSVKLLEDPQYLAACTAEIQELEKSRKKSQVKCALARKINEKYSMKEKYSREAKVPTCGDMAGVRAAREVARRLGQHAAWKVNGVAEVRGSLVHAAEA
jgi:hypothetical protein